MINVSVLVPVYNTSVYLKRCLDSIVSQTLKTIEIIIVDDGSIDESPLIIKEYEEKDKRITVITKPNGGLSSARNRGIEAARGEYILHIDSDDWIEPDMCEILFNEARKNNADIVTSDVYFEFQKTAKVKHEPYHYICDRGAILKCFTFRKGINSVWNKLISRKLYINNNIRHYEDISLGEDSSALLRLFLFSNRLVCINEAFYHYDLRTSGMTRNARKDVMQYLIAVNRVERFYKDNNADILFFPFIRLKICYGMLVKFSFKKVLKYKLLGYIELYKCFHKEIKTVLFNKLFLCLPLDLQIFVLYKFFSFIFYRHEPVIKTNT
jgi:glycosyltransferase involved in cell wall biosynthesis